MSKVQVVPPSGGGAGGMVGFVKLWEGDVTGPSSDVTGGAVDPSEYQVLLVRYTGTLGNTSDASRYFGIGCVSGSTNPTYDTVVSKSSQRNVDFTMTYYARGNYDGDVMWMGVRELRYQGSNMMQTTDPFSFNVSSTTGVTINLHFTIYGVKL